MSFLQELARPNILQLKPYRCARDDYSSGILLDANENAHGPCISDCEWPLHRYPDPHQLALRTRFAHLRRLPGPQHVFVGNGSDEAIDLLFRIFCRPSILPLQGRLESTASSQTETDVVLQCPPTYGMYAVSAQIHSVPVVTVPLTVDFQLDVDKILQKVDDLRRSRLVVKLIWVCSPGNPTAVALNRHGIVRLLDSFDGMVVVDEAYVDFIQTENTSSTGTSNGNVEWDGVGDHPSVNERLDRLLSVGTEKKGSMVPFLSRYPRLVVLQTLSKSFGLAGLRIGVAMGHPDVIQLFNNVKAPYNISQPTSAIASKALEPQSLLRWDSTLLKIQKDHADLSKALLTMRSVASMRGGLDANFLLVRLKSLVAGTDDTQFAELMYKRMAEHRCTNQVSSTQSLQNVVVRFRGREHGCEGCLRVTVGTSTENADLLSLWRLIEDEIIRDFA